MELEGQGRLFDAEPSWHFTVRVLADSPRVRLAWWSSSDIGAATEPDYPVNWVETPRASIRDFVESWLVKVEAGVGGSRHP